MQLIIDIYLLLNATQRESFSPSGPKFSVMGDKFSTLGDIYYHPVVVLKDALVRQADKSPADS